MMIVASLVFGLTILTLGADWLVKGASRLALSYGVSALVVGLTVVAFGTSAPEMTVSALASFKGDTDIALGNVVGSNIFNVLFILGISALIIPLNVHKQLIKIDVPFMIVVSLILWGISANGIISRVEAVFLFFGLIVYMVALVVMSKKEKAKDKKHDQQQMEAELGSKKELRKTRLFSLFLVLVGLVALVLGSKLFVDAAVSLARQWGVSELIIGLTIVAAGTSLPEVATSIMAALKGERDIAVGNVVGSNIFNILGVLGVSGILSPSGLSVATEAQAFDIPVMVAVAFACLPIFFTGNVIKRWEGALFFVYYIFYTAFIVLVASKSTYIENFKSALLYFMLPLTVITLLIAMSRSFKHRKSVF